MNTHLPVPTKTPMHPLIIGAAIAIILVCSLGAAAILGWLPSSTGRNTEAQLADAQTSLASSAAAEANTTPAASDGKSAAAKTPAVETPSNHTAPARKSHTTPTPQRVAIATQADCQDCGVIDAVNTVEHRGQGGAVGTAGGAIVGGLLGNQIGSGNGRKLATVAGAIGGAVAGNQIEGNMKKTYTYNIVVRLNDGTTRTFHQPTQPGWQPGDRVRIVNGALHSDS